MFGKEDSGELIASR